METQALIDKKVRTYKLLSILFTLFSILALVVTFWPINREKLIENTKASLNINNSDSETQAQAIKLLQDTFAYQDSLMARILLGITVILTIIVLVFYVQNYMKARKNILPDALVSYIVFGKIAFDTLVFLLQIHTIIGSLEVAVIIGAVIVASLGILMQYWYLNTRNDWEDLTFELAEEFITDENE
ncbi:hypothetical protein [Granulicatella seriolae]|uniref:DUF2975 domain-containing protein n=1 Tax=Granulicatella seriolae TaxID=2967226 RepID=A0ABT1WQT3_9LACT|nr:hypothetical protein [Granulicatella seriolae]